MKKMKHAISFVAMLLMLVSMFSVFPAAAATVNEEYSNLFANALVVDRSWEGKREGDAINVSFQGKNVSTTFDADWHFASYEDAWAYAELNNIADPVILLNAGVYTETIEIKGAVTLLGSNAGVDPNVKSADKNVAWTLSGDRSFTDSTKETIISGNVKIRASVGVETVVLDGFAFVDGGAILDHERDYNSSEFTVKNTIFKNAGNASSYDYAMYLRSDGHSRTLNLENLYITGQNTDPADPQMPIVGFISPYFVELYADNVAYVENKVGFIAASWFAEGVSPVINVANSCFYNADAATPVGHVLSMDNANYDYDFSKGQNKVIGKDVNKRPTAMLELKDNVFYNASATSCDYNPSVKGGVIHFQFVNTNSTVNMEGNYFYNPDGTTFMDSEFLLNSSVFDQTSCMRFKDNWFIGAYKVPSLNGSNASTYIDLSSNYFSRTGGQVVNFPVFTSEKDQRLIRTSFWVDMDLTVKNTDWDMTTTDWSLAWVDNSTYDVELYMYTQGDVTAALPIKFKALRDGLTVRLYKNATVDADGIAYAVSDQISAIDASMLSNNVYEITTLYAQVTDPNNPYFAPIYTISVRNCGDLNDMPDFSAAYPGYLMAHETASKLSAGTFMPYRWNGKFYKMTVGKNLFPTAEKALTYGYENGQDCPTICLPAGIYEDELSLTGSCTILGEKHGVNPNTKPYDYLTQDKFASSAWTLSPERSVLGEETIFYAPIRVVEGADDYVITIDGIMMVDGCSYVDDCARAADNVTIIKNVYAKDAVGGYDRNGSANTYLFNFCKAFGPVTDRCSAYFYDCRVDGLEGETLFGAYYEKLVIDGLYYAHGKNQSSFFNNMQSRDVADPYYSLTNSYIYENTEGQAVSDFDSFITHDDKGSQAAKKKIIYNFAGNVFYNAFQTGRAWMAFYWAGKNMTVHLSSNTFYADVKGSFIATSTGGNRFGSEINKYEASEVLLIRGNRFINRYSTLTSAFTGPGTDFEWSGNYFSDSLYGTPYTPDTLTLVATNATGTHTYEAVTRFTMDYTYADWDMTVRNYRAGYTGDRVEASTEATLNFGKGPYGTGSYKNENIGAGMMPVYRDSGVNNAGIVYTADTYASPAMVGETDTVKYYSDAACTNEVTTLVLAGGEKIYYGAVLPSGVTNVNAAGVIKFAVVLTRAMSSEAKLLTFLYRSNEGSALIDQAAKTVLCEVDSNSVRKTHLTATVSEGATGKLCKDEAGNVEFTGNLSLSGKTEDYLYYKVTPEDPAAKAVVYKIILRKTDGGNVAGISRIDGMLHVGANEFSAPISLTATEVSFTPVAFSGSTLVVTDNGKKLLPDSNGVYTLNVEEIDSVTLKAVATSKDGSDTAEYTLKFVRETAVAGIKIYGIEGAAAVSTGFAMSLGLNRVVDEIVVNVDPGVTYALYEDYACTKKVADGPIILDKESKILYVKATSADGNLFTVARLTIYTSLMNYKAPVIKATYGNTVKEALYINQTDYVLDLPAGTNKVTLSGALEIAGNDAAGNPCTIKPSAGGEVKFYADPQMKVEIDAKSALELNQKVTKVYYKMAEATYTYYAKNFPTDKKAAAIEAKMKERVGLITINSDRSSVAYSDRNAIPDWVMSYVDYLNDEKHGIFTGDQNKKLNASSNITRNEIATVATRVMGLDVSKYASVELNFADTVDTWAQPYVRAAVGAGIINGMLDGNTGKIYFNGASNATREQVIKILVSVCMINDGITESGADYYKSHKNHVDMTYNNFDFVDEAKVSEWAVPYIHLAVGQYNLVGGSLDNGKLYLNPQKNVTRAEVIKMVACYMGHE